MDGRPKLPRRATVNVRDDVIMSPRLRESNIFRTPIRIAEKFCFANEVTVMIAAF
jgi:hypothetical protein